MHDTLPFLDKLLQASTASTSATVLARLIVAAVLGGAIGLEREMKHRPAGLRTNMFMCFGSALFTMLSAMLAGSGQDQTRIAAQIIAGIGFIGAGSILRSRGAVHGVTTAATVFVVAAIGMCAGAGLMIPAALATMLVLFGLLILGILEQHVFVRRYPAAYMVDAGDASHLHELMDEARVEKHGKLLDVKLTRQESTTRMEFTLEADPGTHDKLLKKLHKEFDTHKIISFASSEQE